MKARIRIDIGDKAFGLKLTQPKDSIDAQRMVDQAVEAFRNTLEAEYSRSRTVMAIPIEKDTEPAIGSLTKPWKAPTVYGSVVVLDRIANTHKQSFVLDMKGRWVHGLGSWTSFGIEDEVNVHGAEVFYQWSPEEGK